MVGKVNLPAGGEWTLTRARLHDNVFLIAENPEHAPLVVGLTAQGLLFKRPLTEGEKALVATA